MSFVWCISQSCQQLHAVAQFTSQNTTRCVIFPHEAIAEWQTLELSYAVISAIPILELAWYTITCTNTVTFERRFTWWVRKTRACRRLLLIIPQQKISVLQHAPEVHLPLRPGDPTPTSRNLDPLMHPFSRARERIRALNAAKIDRIFAKPFVASLDGHIDAVEVLARQHGSLTTVASGSWDGGTYLPSVDGNNRSQDFF